MDVACGYISNASIRHWLLMRSLVWLNISIFFCLQCSTNRPTDGTYNFLVSLARIAARASDVASVRQQAEVERNLLSIYSVSLPPVCVLSVGDVVMIDNMSVVFHYSPWILQQSVSATLSADGNCFFRTVSLALHGTENAHTQLRLLSVIEALLCPTL